MKTRKFTALLLVLCLLLTATPYSAPVHAVEEEHLAQEQAQTETQIETETAVEEAAPAPLAEGIFFRFVDQAVFQANGHVARVPEEETLSTYVFRNNDGTKTVYYLPDNVKYVAEDGAMVEKDLTLVSQAGGYGVKRSDIQYLLPTSAASGIRMTHGNKQVTMYPQAPLGRATDAAVSGDSVRYDNYFGSGIHLVYTPIPSGLKEDIVLDSYTGTSSFSFTIDTNGMRLYNDEGQYYFAASADAEEKIFLGDIIVYDAKGEPSAGTLTVTPVTMGQQYTLTVSADPAFLTDPDTVYPVTIDPTITVSAANNSSFIEDVSLYQNAPNTNTGNWTYNHCGYYASANTDYGVCRTAIRLAGLETEQSWGDTSYSNINSAKFYVKEATGTSTVRIVLYKMTNSTWEESTATWATLANAYESTAYAQANLLNGEWAEFDFTGLAREWKRSNASDFSFMLVSINNTLDKSFYSSEYGDSSCRPYVVITYNETFTDTEGLTYTTKVLEEGGMFRLRWPDVSSNITWTSSDTAIATVSSVGTVTGHKAGKVTITAHAGGYASQSCTVYVTIKDGIYYLRNNRSNYYLGVPNSNVSSNTTLRQETQSTTEPTCFAQMWRITHLSGGYYSIRPVHKPNMALSVSSSILSLQNIGTTDTYSSVPASSRWLITYDQGGGYAFKRGSSYMLPVNHSTVLNATITVGSTNISNSHLWTFILADSFDDQVLLYDKRTSSYSDNIVRYVASGETLTLSQLGIDAAFISEDTIEQNLAWSSGNMNIATLNAATGTITGVSPGNSTTITVSSEHNDITYSTFYTINVAYLALITLKYDGRYLTRYGSAAAASNRISSLVSTLKEYYLSEFELSLQWDLPEHEASHADACDNYENYRCNCEVGVCTNAKDYYEIGYPVPNIHHTNSYNILYRVTAPSVQNQYKIVFVGCEACKESAPEQQHFGTIWGLCDPINRKTIIHDHRSYEQELITLVHEVGHFFNAPDHYNAGTENSTAFLNINNPGELFNSNCIYGENKEALSSIIICDGCRARIANAISSINEQS